MRSDPRILIAPDPLLSQTAKPVSTFDGDALRQLADYMMEVATKVRALGMAAPQLGVPICMILVMAKDTDPIFLVNPSWEPEGEDLTHHSERCFSSPGVEIEVVRSKSIRVRWKTLDGADREGAFDGSQSRIVQHECDHLTGRCLFDRLDPEAQKTYLRDTAHARSRVWEKAPGPRRHGSR